MASNERRPASGLGRLLVLTALGSLALSGAAGAQAQSSPTPLWSHQGNGQEAWQAKVVSLGNNGTAVFTSLGPLADFNRLFPVENSNPPVASINDVGTAPTYKHAVDSAEFGDTHAVLHYVAQSLTGPNKPMVKIYSSSNSANSSSWSYEFPFSVAYPRGGVHVSRDGQTVAAWVYKGGSQAAVAIFDRGSAQPRSYTLVNTFGEPLTGVLSGDGSTLYLAASIRTTIFDTNTASVLFQDFNMRYVGFAQAISYDGTVFIKGLPGSTVEVYRRAGNSYQRAYSHVLEVPALLSAMALSDDTSTLVCGFNTGSNYPDARIQVLELGSDSATVVMDEVVHGGGGQQNLVSDISFAAAAERFAVGLWGNSAGISPELMVYAKREGSWQLHRSFDLEGSVFDTDLSPDGMIVSIAAKTTHASEFSGAGRIEVYDVDQPQGTADMRLVGTPAMGNTVTIEYSTDGPDRNMFLLIAPALESEPRNFGLIGTLFLERSTLRALPMGFSSSSGTASIDFALQDPSLAGQTLYFQGFSGQPRRLSNDWVQMTVTP